MSSVFNATHLPGLYFEKPLLPVSVELKVNLQHIVASFIFADDEDGLGGQDDAY